MCGICGGINLKDPQNTLVHMTRKLIHRGPDDEGFFMDGPIALGHRRLSIIDIDGGRQPMHSADGRYTIVFNGEIYNYRELRAKLIQEGAVFKTSSDTEVILEAYARWGRGCLDSFVGMFAFALWDKLTRSLWLVRDRIGKKPLYYIAGADHFFFASEAKALWAFAKNLDARAIDQYLTYRYVPGQRTFYREIKKLAAASWMLVNADGQVKQTQCWWTLPQERRPSEGLTRARMIDYEEEFRVLFADAVRSRLVADVPVGIFLSSGIDSVSIARQMAKEVPLRAFTMGFHSQIDEVPAVRDLVSQLAGHHTVTYLEDEDFESLPKVFSAMDEPYGDPIVLPTYLLARTARRSLKVVLSGEGADELLGGYIHHKFFRSMPEVLPQFCYKMGAFMAGILPWQVLNRAFDYPAPMGEAGRRRLEDLFKSSGDGAKTYMSFASLFTAEERSGMYTKQWSRQMQDDPNELDLDMQRHFNRKDMTLFDKVLHWDFKTWFPEQTLMKLDRLSMAHGLESRCPYADHRLAEFFFRLPMAVFRRLSGNKAVVRRSYPMSHVPSTRRKRAFYLPVHGTYRKAFNRLEETLLNKEMVNEAGIIHNEAIARLLQERGSSALLTDKKITTLMALVDWMARAKKSYA